VSGIRKLEKELERKAQERTNEWDTLTDIKYKQVKEAQELQFDGAETLD
jgi:hypothetical protein